MSFSKGYFDGSAKPNPGMMTIGGLIKSPDGKIIKEFSTELGDGTNNEAEYIAFIRLIDLALQLGIKDIELYGDSALVVNQVNRTWKAKDDRMKAFRDKALVKLRDFHGWRLIHIKRGFNKEADLLTR